MELVQPAETRPVAHGGTLFLDEIGGLPLQAQAKLLRVLEQKIVERVGAVRPVVVDFRLVAATNRDLTSLVEQGKFREDFYCRLGTMILPVPSLRERVEDIPLLARHFLRQNGADDVEISDQAMSMLMKHRWRGNVRELKSVMERAVSLMEQGRTIEEQHLGSYMEGRDEGAPAPAAPGDLQLKRNLQEEERGSIIKALKVCAGNKTKAARMLGISRSLLYIKLDRLGIDSSDYKA